MVDDSLTLGIFIIVYIMFILYLNYIENLAILKGDINDLKCNPLVLLIDSVGNPQTGTTAFEGCIKKLSSN